MKLEVSEIFCNEYGHFLRQKGLQMRQAYTLYFIHSFSNERCQQEHCCWALWVTVDRLQSASMRFGK